MTEPETPREPALNLPGALTVILIALAESICFGDPAG